MDRPSRWRGYLVSIACLLFAALVTPGSTRVSRLTLSDVEMLRRMERFESDIKDQPRDVIQRALHELGAEMIRKDVRVRTGVVAATYERHKESSIYFGYNYDKADHYYLSDLDSELDGRFRHHRYWASVLRTFGTRQVSFELPIDHATFETLDKGQEISFTCSPAVIVRPKSVYCWPDEIRLDSRGN